MSNPIETSFYPIPDDPDFQPIIRPNSPLWQVMRDAYVASAAHEPTHCAHAAEIRAIAKEAKTRFAGCFKDAGAQIAVGTVIAWLQDAADRAEAGE